MHTRHTFFRRHRRTILALLFLTLFGITVSYATPPTSPYQVGETLDPSCAPGDANCTVTLFPDQTGNAGKYLLTNGTTASWATIATNTFSTGLTDTSGTITNNLSTGVTGGQSVVGGIAAADNLTLSSTTNATKGKILFGSSGYDEANDRLGIGNSSPSSTLDVTGVVTVSTLAGTGNRLLQAGSSGDIGDSGVDPQEITDVFTITGAQNTLISGGVVSWVSGLIFDVSAADYYIQGDRYQSGATQVTLAAADPSNDRIDVIAVDINGNVVVIEGTPSATPSEPEIDSTQYLRLSFVYVPATATAPQNVTSEDIYRENSEWSTSTNQPSIVDFNYATAPHAGTKSVRFSQWLSGTNATFVRASSTTLTGTTLVFYIKTSASWGSNARRLSLQWLTGGTSASNAITMKSGNFGFDDTNTGWQKIAIPISQWTLSSTTADRLRITVGNNSTTSFSLQFDDIELQGGVSNPTPTRNGFLTVAGDSGSYSAQTTSDLFKVSGANSLSTAVASNTVTISLAGDTATPGTTKYYGTDTGGSKGWFSLPSTPTLQQVTNQGSTTTLTTTFGGLNITSASVQRAFLGTIIGSDVGGQIWFKDISSANQAHIYPSGLTARRDFVLADEANATSTIATREWVTAQGFAVTASDLKISSLLAAAATNTIDNADYKQEWQWNTLSGSGLKLSSTSTAATGNGQRLLDLSLSGANATSLQTTYGIYSSNTHTGTSSTNYGGYFTASGGTNNYGVYAVGTGTGVYGSGSTGVDGESTSGYGVYGGSTNSTGVKGSSSIGTGVYGISSTGYGGWFSVSPASTNSIATVLNVDREASGTAANGIGGAIDFTAKTTNGSALTSGRVASQWTDATFATRTGDLEFWTTNSGTSAVKATIAGSGALQLNSYGLGNITGTPAYSLAVDASGNIIEGVAGGTPTLQQVLTAGSTLTTNNTISMGTNVLTLTSSSTNTPALTINASGASQTGLFVSSLSTPLHVETTGLAPAEFKMTRSTISSPITVLNVIRETTGTAFDNIGAQIGFGVEDAAGATQTSNELISQWSTAADATRTSKFSITGVKNAATAVLFELGGSGSLKLNKYGIGTFTGTPAYSLAVDASGNIIEGVAGGTPTLEQVINAGSSFTSNHTISMGANALSITSTITSSPALSVTATGTNSTGLYANSAYVAISGRTTGSTYAAQFDRNASSTNSVLPVLSIMRTSTGTAANGIGGSLDFQIQDSSFTQVANTIVSKWTDATDATRTSQLIITGLNTGTSANLLTLSGSGALQLNKYGTGAFTGTAAYSLAVDAGGNVIEVTGGGSLIGSTSSIGSETWLGDATLGTASTSNTVFIGTDAGLNATSANSSVFLGWQAGDGATGAFASQFIGVNAGYLASSASNANFIGGSAGREATSANDSNFIGDYTGYQASSADNSNFMGQYAGYQATNARYANFFGYSSGANATSASYSIFVGYNAGYQAATAKNSIFIGTDAGYLDAVNTTTTFDDYSILIGEETSTGGFKNSIGLGAYATNTASNQFMIGSSTKPIDSTKWNGSASTQCTLTTGTGIACTSDERLKTNIEVLPGDILEQLTTLKTVTFNWAADPEGSKQIGFIAQNLEQVFPELVATDSNGYKSVYYSQITPVLVEAIRELDFKLNDIANFDNPADDSFVSHLRAWLANASNHIARIFTGEICLTDPDGSSECLNKTELTQLKQLINSSAADSSTIAGGTSSTETQGDTQAESGTDTTSNAGDIGSTDTTTTDTTTPDNSSTDTGSTDQSTANGTTDSTQPAATTADQSTPTSDTTGSGTVTASADTDSAPSDATSDSTVSSTSDATPTQ